MVLQNLKNMGYTLIELLVAISVIAILSIVTFINFKGFSQDQLLNEAVGQVQTMLWLAQSNATSGLKCNNNPAKSWMVEFSKNLDQYYIKLKCNYAQSPDVEKKTLTLKGGVTVDAISHGSECLTVTFPTNTMTILYTTLYGKTEFILARGVGGSECNADVPTITVTLKRNNSTKILTINKGGAIDVQ